MHYYDFHVRSDFSEGQSSLQDFAKRAKILGYKGICFSEYFTNEKNIPEMIEKCRKIGIQEGIDVFLGFQARNRKELCKLVRLRKNYDILLVRGGDIELNRLAVETPEVDILLHPEFNRRDSGLNHTMVKIAAENKVAIEVNFREILLSTHVTRANLLHKMGENIRLCQKYKCPVIVCSGAISHLQLRDPKVLLSISSLLGLKDPKKSLSTIPEEMIKKIRERQSEKWIMPGVKVV